MSLKDYRFKTAFISTPFVYRDIKDRIRLTESTFIAEFANFAKVKSERLGNGFTVIWDILRRKVYSANSKIVRYLLFMLIMPYFAVLKIFKIEDRKDDYYSGLFFILQK